MNSDLAPISWLARGFIAAHDRLHEGLRGVEAEAAFAPLFETLSWLDALLLSEDIKPNTQDGRELIEALKFARGRIHHQWFSVIELREDVRHPPTPLGLDTRTWQHVSYIDENVYIDWCWVAVSAMRGSGRDPQRRELYAKHLAGKPVRFALGRFRDLANLIDIVDR